MLDGDSGPQIDKVIKVTIRMGYTLLTSKAPANTIADILNLKISIEDSIGALFADVQDILAEEDPSIILDLKVMNNSNFHPYYVEGYGKRQDEYLDIEEVTEIQEYISNIVNRVLYHNKFWSYQETQYAKNI